MIDRRLRDRLSKIDERASDALMKRKKNDETYIENLLFSARHHATAVAAIVLSGQPKIEEPLITAWERTLRRYGFQFHAPGELDYQVGVVRQLGPAITEGKEISARLTEIFAAAPIWLLQFTGVAWDARLLNFDLPEISTRLPWGSAGYEDAGRWPRLPEGTLTAGDPIPSIDPRQLWIAMFCMLTDGDPLQAFNERFSEEETEEFPSTGNPLADEIMRALPLVLEIDENPDRKWLPHEVRHMRKITERLARLMAEAKEKRLSRRR